MLDEWKCFILLSLFLFSSLLSSQSHRHTNVENIGGLHPSCAKLERGGFFNDKTHWNFTEPLFAFQHMPCYNGKKCNLRWESTQSLSSLSFKLFGVDDMRDYDFQLHFCERVYLNHHLMCTGNQGEIAYDLQLKGVFFFLIKIYCRCIDFAEPAAYGYSKPVESKTDFLRPRIMQMTCRKHPVCEHNGVCYQERIGRDNRIRMGKIQCVCSKKQFCPLYYIWLHRIDVTVDGKFYGYDVKCKDREY